MKFLIFIALLFGCSRPIARQPVSEMSICHDTYFTLVRDSNLNVCYVVHMNGNATYAFSVDCEAFKKCN